MIGRLKKGFTGDAPPQTKGGAALGLVGAACYGMAFGLFAGEHIAATAVSFGVSAVLIAVGWWCDRAGTKRRERLEATNDDDDAVAPA